MMSMGSGSSDSDVSSPSLSTTDGRDLSSVEGNPFLFYTAGTPNGRKVAILLEELKEEYGLGYE